MNLIRILLLVAIMSVEVKPFLLSDSFLTFSTIQNGGSKNIFVRSLSSTKHPIQHQSLPDELELIFDKALDTIEDIDIHLRRLLPLSEHKNNTKRPQLVVLGSGWGAHAFLKVIDTDIYDVVCISPRPYFIFTPMLASTAVGTVEYRSIVENIRSANPTAGYIEGEAISIDKRGSVTVKSALESNKLSSFNVPFDILVYAVGSQVADFGVEGVKENCCFIKEIVDVRKLKQSVFDAFERASLPTTSDEMIDQLLTFVIIGGGPTGVEFSGELADFTREDVTRLYPKLAGRSKIILLNSAPAILSTFDESLQKIALATLRSEGVDIRLKTRVLRVDPSVVSYRESSNGGEIQLPFGVCVWAAGNAYRKITSSFAKEVGHNQEAEVASKSRLAVDSWLRLKSARNNLSFPNIFAIGDAASTIDSTPLPQTAQVAAQQGAYLARLLNRKYNCSESIPSMPGNVWTNDPLQAIRLRGVIEAKPFNFLNLGLLAYVGDSEAVAQIQLGDLSILDTSGSKAYWLWRSVYVVKQVSIRTRLLVIFDFIKTKIFGRDFTTL